MGTSKNKVNKTIYIVLFVIVVVVLFVIISLFSGQGQGQGQGQPGFMGQGPSPYNSFQLNQGQGFGLGSVSFMETNSLIAKVAFLFIVIFLFVIFLRIGIAILTFAFTTKGQLHLFDGMVDGRQTLVFDQDPAAEKPATIYRSTDGLTFTWSAWIYIDDLTYLSGQYRHIFSKGNSDIDQTGSIAGNLGLSSGSGLVSPNNAPGLYLDPKTNNLIVLMNTYNNVLQEITIDDVPLNKWVNVIIRCKNKSNNGAILDVYINGTITKSLELNDVPRQNYGDVFVGLNGGFSGYVSNLWYWAHDLSIGEIQHIIAKGPNTKMANTNIGPSNKMSDYLSLRWFFGGSGDQFNPGP